MQILKSLSFIILNPDNNHTALRITTKTITQHFSECKVLCVLGSDLEVEDNKRYAECIRGGNTITSLIDAGVQRCKTDWCFILMAGTYLRNHSLRKYENFCRSEKDILYPVIDRKFVFEEASINGILMHRKAIEEVGLLGDNNRDIELVKMIWALLAIEKNYKFKALVGARLI